MSKPVESGAKRPSLLLNVLTAVCVVITIYMFGLIGAVVVGLFIYILDKYVSSAKVKALAIGTILVVVLIAGAVLLELAKKL